MTSQNGCLDVEEKDADTLSVVRNQYNSRYGWVDTRLGTTMSHGKISSYLKEHGYTVELQSK